MSAIGLSRAFDARAALEGPRQRRRSTIPGFWSKVDRDGPVVRTDLGPCWEWTGRRNKDGYGLISWCGVDVVTHRLAYSLEHGPIEAGTVIRHRCDNPACCNPLHLTTGSIADNNRDMVERGRNRVDQLVRRGESNARAKLTDETVIELRAAWCAGESIKSISRRTGLNPGTVHPMLFGDTWAHVPLSDRAVARRSKLEARRARRST